MQTYSKEKVEAMIAGAGTLEYDNSGQLIIYTGVFLWRDGSYHDMPDPDMPDDAADS